MVAHARNVGGRGRDVKMGFVERLQNGINTLSQTADHLASPWGEKKMGLVDRSP